MIVVNGKRYTRTLSYSLPLAGFPCDPAWPLGDFLTFSWAEDPGGPVFLGGSNFFFGSFEGRCLGSLVGGFFGSFGGAFFGSFDGPFLAFLGVPFPGDFFFEGPIPVLCPGNDLPRGMAKIRYDARWFFTFLFCLTFTAVEEQVTLTKELRGKDQTFLHNPGINP